MRMYRLLACAALVAGCSSNNVLPDGGSNDGGADADAMPTDAGDSGADDGGSQDSATSFACGPLECTSYEYCHVQYHLNGLDGGPSDAAVVNDAGFGDASYACPPLPSCQPVTCQQCFGVNVGFCGCSEDDAGHLTDTSCN